VSVVRSFVRSFAANALLQAYAHHIIGLRPPIDGQPRRVVTDATAFETFFESRLSRKRNVSDGQMPGSRVGLGNAIGEDVETKTRVLLL